MENVFAAVPVVLLAAAVLTYFTIVRDVMPHLAPEHRHALHHHFDSRTFQQLRAGDKAIGKAWQTHILVFPKSRKRALFATFLIAAALSLFSYPLWLILR